VAFAYVSACFVAAIMVVAASVVALISVFSPPLFFLRLLTAGFLELSTVAVCTPSAQALSLSLTSSV